jgi:alpha-beta hydrolase superfamily lysophospholipase
LLLRGLTREQRHWHQFPDMLAQTLGIRVACLDLPGFGSEHRRRSPASIGAITDDLRGRFAALRGDGRWSVLGISLGGMVALDWCARNAADFERCVVINSSSRLSPARDRFRRAVLPSVLSSLVGDAVAHERAVLRISSNGTDELDNERIVALHAGWRVERPYALRSAVAQMVAATRFRLPTPVPVPVLVLSSTADRLVSHACSQRIARALGAPLHLHDGAGHELTLDAPDWTCQKIAEWVRDARGCPTPPTAQSAT